MKTTHRTTALFAALGASLLIVACGEKLDDATVGQQVDSSVATVQSAGSRAADTVADTANDLAITAKVNAALAADEQLSALKINVDTEAGNVELKGTAPDEASRARATTLTAAVEGVVTVENRLTLEKSS